MALRRTKRDMFGREAAQLPTQSSAVRSPARTGAQGTSLRWWRRPIPVGLRPWLLPLGLVVVLAGVAIAPGVGLGLLLVGAGAIGVRRYRLVKDLDYSELRRQDPFIRGLDDYRHGRGYRGLDSPTADNDGTISLLQRDNDPED